MYCSSLSKAPRHCECWWDGTGALCVLSKMFIIAKVDMPELANWHERNVSLVGKVLSLCCLLETIVVFWITSGLHKEHKLLCSLSLLTVWQIYNPIFQVWCLENECVFEMKTISVLEHHPSGTGWIITCSSPWVILIFPEACSRCFLFSCQNILKRKLFLIKYSNHTVITKCIFSCQIVSSHSRVFAVT